MDDVVKGLLNEANKALEIADHLIFITYPTIKEVKLIVTATEGLFSAVSNAMDALLYYDRLYKRISNLPADFISRFELFKKSSAPRYNIDRTSVLLIDDLRRFKRARENSKLEFIRGEKFVMCSDVYKMQTITLDKAKDYLSQSKDFINRVRNILK